MKIDKETIHLNNYIIDRSKLWLSVTHFFGGVNAWGVIDFIELDIKIKIKAYQVGSTKKLNKEVKLFAEYASNHFATKCQLCIIYSQGQDYLYAVDSIKNIAQPICPVSNILK